MAGSEFDPLLPIGGLGMFLLGMHIMTGALRSLAGDSLARALRRSTDSPLSGAIVGTLTTALVQSSSATTVAAVGFVSAGVLSFTQALGIIFGANVGTTITGWLVALLGFKLDLARLVMPLILGGIVLRLAGKRRTGDVGMAMAGFGLIFVGIGALQDGFAFINGVADPSWLPEPGLVGRLMMVGLGFLLTAITQSSSAGVAFAIAAVHAGAIPFEHAAAAVIGMDLGSSATALLASVGATRQGRRTGVAHFVFNVFTVVLALLMLSPYAWALGVERIAAQPELALVGFHTSFNVLATACGIPFIRPFARLIERIVPDHRPPVVATLDPKLVAFPELAIPAARRAAEYLRAEIFTDVASRMAEGEILEASPDRKLALDMLRDYLDEVSTHPRMRRLHREHRDLIHACDHLRRLSARLDRGRVPSPDRGIWGELIASISTAIIGEGPAELGRRYNGLVERERELRELVMARVADGSLDADQAMRHLDRGRSARRTLHHAYRVVHHLAGMDQTTLVDLEDELGGPPVHES